MKTIVFIGTQKSGSSREAIKAAERLGYYTVLLTDRTTFIEKRTEFPDVHLMRLCDLKNIDELRSSIKYIQSKSLNISAVVSFVDPHCHTACVLAEELGINHFSTEAIGNMLNKIRSREILHKSSFAPYFDVLLNSLQIEKEEIEKKLPIVMKSPNSTGSKDVFKINNYKEYKHYMKKLFKIYPNEPILIEEFLDGPQYLVETVVYGGKLNIIAIFHQEITFVERFIVTGYDLLLEPSEEFLNKLESSVESIVKAHGLENGPCHLEMRYIKEQWKLIEVNPRISGGAMNKLIEIGLGINLVEETIKMALGCRPNFEPKYKKYAFCQHVIVSSRGILEKVTGKKKASRCKGVECVYVKPRKGSLLTPPLSMGNRYAYVIATGATKEEAIANAKNAALMIKFSLKALSEEEQQEIGKDAIVPCTNNVEKPSEDVSSYVGNSIRRKLLTR